MEVSRPGDRHHTEVAFIRATAYRLHGVERDIPFSLQQVAPGLRDVGEAIARFLIVARLHLPCRKVAQELWPRLFCIADDDGVRVRLSLFGNKCWVDTAENNLDIPR